MKRISLGVFGILFVGSLSWFVMPSWVNGRVVYHELMVADAIRKCRIFVPGSMSESAGVAIAFHGVGDSPDSMAKYARLDALAAAYGFLLVCPEAKDSMWRTEGLDTAKLEGHADVQFFDELCRLIESEYPNQQSSIRLMGMSNGASMVHLLLATRSELIDGVVIHSGLIPKSIEPPPLIQRAVFVVGAEDDLLPFVKRDAHRYRACGHEVELVVVPGLGHEWSTGSNQQVWRFLSGQ